MENSSFLQKPRIRKTNLLYPDLSYNIVGAAFEVYKSVGYGHPEKIYQRAMAIMLKEKGLAFQEQVFVPYEFRSEIIGRSYLDFVVEEKIIVELKRNTNFSKIHIDQVLRYLKHSQLKLAILIDFGKEGAVFRRIINETEATT